MLYFDEQVTARPCRSSTGQHVRVGWGKGERAVAVAMTPAQARALMRELAAAIATAETGTSRHDQSAFNQIVGANVRRERDAAGLTAAEMAKLAGLSCSFVSDLENGKRGVSAENLAGLARALGCTVEELLRGAT